MASLTCLQDARKSSLAAGLRVTACAVAVVAALPPRASATEVDHCTLPERAVFSCSTGTKTLSVCASEDLSATGGVLQYRFGRPAAVELSYPPAGADWREVTHGGTLIFSGGGGAFLAFTRGRHRYIVYSAIGKGWGTKAGVVVEKGDQRIANILCKSAARSELGPDLFQKAGIAEAGDTFELP